MNERGQAAGIERRGRLSKLLLTGFMGAGKSTVGAIVAGLLGWRFIDLDRFIESGFEQKGAPATTVADIFRDRGEAYFRALEGEAIRKLSREEQVVLALGGGTVEVDATREFLLALPATCMVFLDAPLAELMARCDGNGPARPLLTTQEALAERLNRRLPLYRSAHITISTSAQTPREVAGRLVESVEARWRLGRGQEGRAEKSHG